jgi:putative copper resistance protein D
MNWAWTESDGLLIVIRATHFAAAAVTAGALIFRAVVAEPAARRVRPERATFASPVRSVAWIGLAVTVSTGAIWLHLQTMRMAGLPFGDALSRDALGTVIGETQFGQASAIRLVFALILASFLVFDRVLVLRWLALASALGLAAGIAWTGHAGSTPSDLGNLHLAADILHLWAAAAWIGGLVLLALLLIVARRQHDAAWRAFELDAIRRFSTLGIVSVATLTLSGVVSAWILVGSWRGLVVTDYGRLLSIKLVVFAAMLTFAAVNRFWLTPQLGSPAPGLERDAFRRLTRNTLIEITLGLAVFVIVGALGMQHPAIHLAM